MGARLKVYYTTEQRLPSLEIRDGQLIFVSDTNTIYLDMHGARLCYNSLIYLSTEQARLDCVSPNEGFYFVIETKTLWLYKTEWVQINNEVPNILFFGEANEFPLVGDPNMLYIDDDTIYCWNEDESAYTIVASHQKWLDL